MKCFTFQFTLSKVYGLMVTLFYRFFAEVKEETQKQPCCTSPQSSLGDTIDAVLFAPRPTVLHSHSSTKS